LSDTFSFQKKILYEHWYVTLAEQNFQINRVNKQMTIQTYIHTIQDVKKNWRISIAHSFRILSILEHSRFSHSTSCLTLTN